MKKVEKHRKNKEKYRKIAEIEKTKQKTDEKLQYLLSF